MKALQTQFDDKRLSSAVATPTCSSCCCCCCCLATSVASSTLLAQRIAKEGEKRQIFNRHMLTILAALFVPIVGALTYFGSRAANTLFSTCSDEILYDNEHYTSCTAPGETLMLPLLVATLFSVLLYLYARVRIKNPLKRAALVTTLISIAFTVEFIGGAMLILTGAGGIVYLILVPIAIGWITVWYQNHIGKEVGEDIVTDEDIARSLQVAGSSRKQITEHHDKEPTEELSQQKTPTRRT